MGNLCFHLTEFDGPLDLLLHLISKNKVDIYDRPISDILTQYLEYMPDGEDCDIEQASEFAAMAAKLIYIKSRMLLPHTAENSEDDDPRNELVDMLVEYKKIKEVVPYLSQMSENGRDVYVKEPSDIDFDNRIVYNYNVSDLLNALEYIKSRSGREKLQIKSMFSGIVGKQRVSVSERSDYILCMLSSGEEVCFKNFFQNAKNKCEVIATFLAALELLKENIIQFRRNENDYIFKVLPINKVNEGSDEINKKEILMKTE